MTDSLRDKLTTIFCELVVTFGSAVFIAAGFWFFGKAVL